MDYSLRADDSDCRSDRTEELEQLAPEPPPVPPQRQCGQCKNYQSSRTIGNQQRWGYCKLRAQADIHPCNLPPWDTYAEQCTYYREAAAF